jgi:hypothetical protein
LHFQKQPRRKILKPSLRANGAAQKQKISPLVIPDARKREHGIHTPDRGYEFRAQPCGLPRNDEGLRPIQFPNSRDVLKLSLRAQAKQSIAPRKGRLDCFVASASAR